MNREQRGMADADQRHASAGGKARGKDQQP
jgi:hypothetical protein